VDLSDIESTEPEYYKSLRQILEMTLDTLGLDLTFVADTHKFGRHEVYMTMSPLIRPLSSDGIMI